MKTLFFAGIAFLTLFLEGVVFANSSTSSYSSLLSAGGTPPNCSGAGCLLTCVAHPDAPTIPGFLVYRSVSTTCYQQNTAGAPGKFIDGLNPFDAVYLDGNVGIGTNTPSELLEVQGSATDGLGTKIKISDFDGNPELKFSKNNGTDWAFFKDIWTGDLNIWSEAMGKNIVAFRTNGMSLEGGSLSNVADPVNPTDASTKKYVDAKTPPVCFGVGKVLQYDGTNWMCING